MTILEKWELDHPNQKEIYAIFGDGDTTKKRSNKKNAK